MSPSRLALTWSSFYKILPFLDLWLDRVNLNPSSIVRPADGSPTRPNKRPSAGPGARANSNLEPSKEAELPGSSGPGSALCGCFSVRPDGTIAFYTGFDGS